MQDDDRDSYHDRDKKSFSERDRMRREGRPGEGAQPRGPGGQARAKEATQAYLKQIDALFSGGKNAEAEKVLEEMLDARGTPQLAEACRSYRQALGPPTEMRSISCFLDAGEPELVRTGLEALRSAHAAGTLQVSAGLRSQLRMLTQDPDDEVAETAEELLDVL